MSNRFNSTITQLSNLTPAKLQLLASYFELQASRCNNSLYTTGIVTVISVVGGIASFLGANALGGRKAALLKLVGLVCSIVALFALMVMLVIMSNRNTNLSWYNRCNDFIQLNKNISS